MMTSRKSKATRTTDKYYVRDYVLKKLARLRIPVALTVEDDLALIEACVPSAEATRMLAPLGREAVGRFWPIADNMVVIDVMVSLNMALKMMAARSCDA